MTIADALHNEAQGVQRNPAINLTLNIRNTFHFIELQMMNF